MLTVLLTYAAGGAIAGFMAGLLGIGGGLVIVPIMVYCLTWQGVSHEVVMHLALGTSMACIIFTGGSGTLAHHRHGTVDWRILHRIAGGLFVGALLGTFVASRMSTNVLKGVFGVFLYCAAVDMILDTKPRPTRHLPGRAGLFGAGSVIGVASGMLGIGGGALSLPFLVWCNVPMHYSIGTATAMALPIAVAGTLGYIYHGLHVSHLPASSLGYVYLPALAGIACAGILTAPLGASVSERLPVKELKIAFAVLLIVVGTDMLLRHA